MLTWHTAGQDDQTSGVCFNWNHGLRESKRSRSTQLVVVHTFETAKHSGPNLRRLPKPEVELRAQANNFSYTLLFARRSRT